MRSTFKCWLIANFEIAIFWIVIIIGFLIFLIFYPPIETLDNFRIQFLFLSPIFLAAFTMPTKKGAFSFGRYLVMLGLGVFFSWAINQPDFTVDTDAETLKRETILITKFWIIFAIASVPSIFCAIYAYHNIDEVVSRRMLYRNSNVNLFEFSWLYTLDRFCNITFSIVACSLWLLAVWYLNF